MNDNNHKINQIRQFLEKEPEDCFLLHALALEHWKQNDVAEAQALFEKVLRINEKYIGSYYQLGQLMEQLLKPEEAIIVYKKGIDIAKKLKENHALSELRSALENVEDY